MPLTPPQGWADPSNPFDSRPHNPSWYYPMPGGTPPTPPPPPVPPQATMPDPSGLRLRIFLPNLVIVSWDKYPDLPNVELHVWRADVAQSGGLGMPGAWTDIAAFPTSVTAFANHAGKIGGLGADAEIYRLVAVNTVTGEQRHQMEPYEQVGTHTSQQLGV